MTPKAFCDELAALGAVENITVRINSPGGDVFAAQAIGNALEMHHARVTARIEGLCASAATIVACHCDTVTAAEDAVYMIHPVRMGVCGYVSADELRQYLNAVETIRESIVSLYARKTGRDKDEVAAQMDATSWWTAAEAKEHGFVDELLQSNGQTVVENRGGTLFVNSVETGLAVEDAPEFVRSRMTAGAERGLQNKNPAEWPELTDTEEESMEIKNLAELEKVHPDLVAEARAEATAAERSRIRDIYDMVIPGMEAAAKEAMFGENPASATDYAKTVAKNMREAGTNWLNSARKDAAASGVDRVNNSTVPIAGAADPNESYLNVLRGMAVKK